MARQAVAHRNTQILGGKMTASRYISPPKPPPFAVNFKFRYFNRRSSAVHVTQSN